MEGVEPTKEVVTCAEMARMCGLSRSRFYMLVKEGVLPEPSRNPTTDRPFFTREQQRQCLLVRKTNCGINGRAILFYAHRAPTTIPGVPRRRSNAGASRQPRQPQIDPVVLELQHGLEQLGMENVPEARIRAILAATHPDGYANVPPSQLLMTVFRGVRERQDSQDNVTR